MKRPLVYWPVIMIAVLVFFASHGARESARFLFWLGLFLVPLGYLVGFYAETRGKRRVAPWTRKVAWAAAAVVLAAIPGAFIHDIYLDRLQTITLTGPTNLFSEPEMRPDRRIAQIDSAAQVKVLRIRNLKDGIAFHVQVSDGREGWIFAGPNVSVK